MRSADNEHSLPAGPNAELDIAAPLLTHCCRCVKQRCRVVSDDIHQRTRAKCASEWYNINTTSSWHWSTLPSLWLSSTPHPHSQPHPQPARAYNAGKVKDRGISGRRVVNVSGSPCLTHGMWKAEQCLHLPSLPTLINPVNMSTGWTGQFSS